MGMLEWRAVGGREGGCSLPFVSLNNGTGGADDGMMVMLIMVGDCSWGWPALLSQQPGGEGQASRPT